MKIDRDENGKLTGIHISDGEAIAIIIILGMLVRALVG